MSLPAAALAPEVEDNLRKLRAEAAISIDLIRHRRPRLVSQR